MTKRVIKFGVVYTLLVALIMFLLLGCTGAPVIVPGFDPTGCPAVSPAPDCEDYYGPDLTVPMPIGDFVAEYHTVTKKHALCYLEVIEWRYAHDNCEK